MDLKVDNNVFVKLRDFFKLIDISVEVDEYDVNNDILEGNLQLKGKYLKRDNVTEEYYNEKIPFSVAFPINDIEVDDIDCVDLEYNEVDGRGIDVSFDILIKYQTYEEIPVEVDDRKLEKIEVDNLEDVDYEMLKKEETNRIDNLLKSALEIKDDNLPTNEVIIRGLKENRGCISVCYYKDEKELEKVCEDKGLSLGNVFKNNQQYDINQYHRVIISEK